MYDCFNQYKFHLKTFSLSYLLFVNLYHRNCKIFSSRMQVGEGVCSVHSSLDQCRTGWNLGHTQTEQHWRNLLCTRVKERKQTRDILMAKGEIYGGLQAHAYLSIKRKE